MNHSELKILISLIKYKVKIKPPISELILQNLMQTLRRESVFSLFFSNTNPLSSLKALILLNTIENSKKSLNGAYSSGL